MSDKKKKLPYFSDVQLFKRVDKYLDDYVDKPMVDKEAMVDELRNTYKEYQRRSRSAFRLAVFKAHHMISQNVVEVMQGPSDNESDVEALDELVMQGPSNNGSDIEALDELVMQGPSNNGSDIEALDELVMQVPSNNDSDVEALDEQVSPEVSSPQNEGLPSGQNAASQMKPIYLRRLNFMASPVGARSSQNSNIELINISSDEGEDDSEAKRPKISPPPSNHHQAWHTPVQLDNQSLWASESRPKHNAHNRRKNETPRDATKRKRSSKKAPPSYPALLRSKLIFPGRPLLNTIPEISFREFGGYPKVLQAINDLFLHFYQSDIYKMLGVTPPRGFILHGPPGCGKTLLAHAIAGELRLPLVKVSGPELIGGIAGESEERIRKIFQQAKQQAPCILFIDEIDVISQMRENARRDMERRIVSQLIVSLDDLSSCEEGDELIVIGATNRVEELDHSLRRAGRFDKEVCIGIPDRTAREGILRVLCRLLKMSKNISIEKIAELTPGYVAADLKSLISEAAVAAVKRIFMENAKNKKVQCPKILNEEPIKIEDEESKSNDLENIATVGGDGESAPVEKEDDIAEPDSSDAEEVEKPPVEPVEVMDVDLESVADDEVSSAKEVIENEGGEEDKESEDMDACVIIEDGKAAGYKKVSTPLGNSPQYVIQVEIEDLMSALKTTQPSAKREGFATVPDVTWDDIGSLKDVRDELTMSIMMPVKYPDEFARMGIDAPSGIMLWGPPGCGKTLLAKAIANEANINFISVKGPELLNMYVGESEKAVRTCFQRARNSQPCVIFFDEIDALCPRRSDSAEGSVSSRVVNQVLTEMDGVEGRKGVFLMAASNRPDMVDPAVLRPGRLDKIVKVGLPNANDRIDILRAITKNGTKPPLDENVSLEKIASSPECEGYSGADLAALVKEASILALANHLTLLERSDVKEDLGKLCVNEKHFEGAMMKIKPSVRTEERERYERIEKIFSSVDY